MYMNIYPQCVELSFTKIFTNISQLLFSCITKEGIEWSGSKEVLRLLCRSRKQTE